MHHLIIRRALTVGAVAVGLLLAGPARAQSENELRRDNQRLQAQVRDLQKELEAAREQIARLQSENERLLALLDAARRGEATPQPPPPPEVVSVDESVPHASPRALLRAMTESYKEATADRQLGRADDRDRRAYLGAVRSWASRVNRELKAPVQWHVRVRDAVPGRSGVEAEVLAVDPKTDVVLGDSFRVMVPRHLARRLQQQRTEAEVYVLRGTLFPEARLNEDRLEPGPFDSPPLIGPFAEFGFRVDVRSFLPVAEDAAEQEKEAEKKGGD